MTFRTLIRRSLRFHWRSHLGVVLGAAIGSAALIGALVVGDSVKISLTKRVFEKFRHIEFVLDAKDRTFTDQLISSSSEFNSTLDYPPLRRTVLFASGTASKVDGSARANAISIYGLPQISMFGGELQPQTSVTNDVWDIWDWAGMLDAPPLPPGEIWLNPQLSKQLNVGLGETLILRIQKTSGLASEAAMSPRSDNTAALQLRVTRILGPERLGDFSIRSEATPPLNAFVNLSQLQQVMRLEGRANLIVVSGIIEDVNHPAKQRIGGFLERLSGSLAQQFNDWFSTYGDFRFSQTPKVLHSLEQALPEIMTLSDYEIAFRQNDSTQSLELVSRRVFIDTLIEHTASRAETNAHPILTYLATLIQFGTNTTPYSMVTAAGAPWTPTDLRDDEIVVGQWLADDLRVKPGDEIAVSYFLPESGAKLEEATNRFRVHSIVPMEMPWADRTLMPDFPGIEKAESTSEWDAGFPLTYEIRKKDDDYWKQYRGTPKAFITLAAGQRMWGNRFGDLTAIRFVIPTNAPTKSYQAELEKKILANLKPAELGLRFEPVREQALKAAAESQDFGGLFLGFSFFLIIAALLLMAMLFQFGLEQRASEVGTLLALGFTPKQVRNLFLREGMALAFIGGVLGAGGGIYFAKAMLHGLTTVWRDAVGATALNFHFTVQTLGIGIFASVVVSTITIWLALRKFVKRSPRELLIGEIQAEGSKAQSPKSKVIAIATVLLALGLVGWTLAKGDTANAGAFFGAGALMLVAGLFFVSAWLAKMERDAPAWRGEQKHAPLTMAALAVRGCSRRRKRSLATVAMLACGSFLIVSIGVFRLDANRDATKRDSGTGGFALIGETTMPVVQDLNSASGRDFFALNEQDLKGVNVVPFRVRAGDEASCLNLNAAQKPRLLGVKPMMLEGRFAFAKGTSWPSLRLAMSQSLLTSSLTNEIEIPAIGDANSIEWAMHKKVGDTIDYVDERGQPFKVRIVGAVANSILQGQLIIDEAEFVKRFPGESGYRMFLVDAPSNAVSQVSATLSRAMQDVGLELTPAAQRLDQFNAVQNTYLGTFQVLGGLGLLLGSVGLGIVVLRNVLERRSELAVLMAVGFRKQQVQRLLLVENGALLVVGLAIGMVAAGIAILPALLATAAQLPLRSLVLTLAAVLLNGALWTWAATRYAVRGDLLKALRNE